MTSNTDPLAGVELLALEAAFKALRWGDSLILTDAARKIHAAGMNNGEGFLSSYMCQRFFDAYHGAKEALTRPTAAVERTTPDAGQIEAAAEAEAWLRECSSWLLSTDLDMTCPMETDPLDIADKLAALSTQPIEGLREAPKSYADWQQRRGMLADKVDWAILEYDEYMKDDAYDAQDVLDRIIAGLREIATLRAYAP